MHNRAARSASAASPATIPSSHSQRASLATRSTLSATVPSFSWNTICDSFCACVSSGTWTSFSQKNLASREARGDDLAVAVDDRRAAIGRVDVRGADEGVGQFAVRVRTHEILLVHPRGELDDLLRHRQIAGVEPPEQRHRPLGQPGIFDNQPFILDQRQACGGGRRPRAVADDRAALAEMDDDVAGAEFLDVIVGAADGDRAGMDEAVAKRRGARFNAVDAARHDGFAEQRDDALQRADPAQAFGRERCGAPAHRFGPGKGADDGGDRVGQDADRGTPGLVDHREEGRATFHFAGFERITGQARFAQEPSTAASGASAGGPFNSSLTASVASGRSRAISDEAARGGEGFDACSLQAMFRQFGFEQARQIGLGLNLHSRGDFFRAQLEQEIGAFVGRASKLVAHAAHPLISIHLAQAPFARSRTRPI